MALCRRAVRRLTVRLTVDISGASVPSRSRPLPILRCRPLSSASSVVRAVVQPILPQHDRILLDYAQQEPTPMTLQQMRSAANPQNISSRLSASKFLHRELSIRYARCVKDLTELPLGLGEMPSITLVRDMYLRFFRELQSTHPPTTEEEDVEYTSLLSAMKERGQIIVPAIARGLREYKRSHYYSPTVFRDPEIQEDLRKSLDEFFLRRIGIRMLIGQHSESKEKYGGRVARLNPAQVAESAARRATTLCRKIYGAAPRVEVITSHGSTKQPFIYVESHLHHILFELIKNSMRAVVEAPVVQHHETYRMKRQLLARHMDIDSPLLGFLIPEDIPDHVTVHPPFEFVEGEEYPPIRVIISQGSEDMCIKVSDQGGGVPRSDWPKLFTYTYTTAPPPKMDEEEEEIKPETFREHFAGGGYGLPIARLFARYFGGDLTLISMEGFGTDAYLQLHRLGNSYEVVPGAANKRVLPLAY